MFTHYQSLVAAVFPDTTSPTTGYPTTDISTTASTATSAPSSTTGSRGINPLAQADHTTYLTANHANLDEGRKPNFNPEAVILQLLYSTLLTDTASSLESTPIVNNTPVPPWKLNIPLSSLITTSTTHTNTSSTSKKENVSNLQGSTALASKDPMQIFLSSLPDFSYLLKPTSDIVPPHLQ